MVIFCRIEELFYKASFGKETGWRSFRCVPILQSKIMPRQAANQPLPKQAFFYLKGDLYGTELQLDGFSTKEG